MTPSLELQAALKAIQALPGPSAEAINTASVPGVAMGFVYAYAQSHEYFVSGDVLDDFKASPLYCEPEGGKGWRDKWAHIMMRCVRAGWITKAGKAAPTSKDTHMSSVALWRSRLFEGERTAIETGQDFLDTVRVKWMTREITDLRQMLRMVYDYGFDAGLTHQPPKKAKP